MASPSPSIHVIQNQPFLGFVLDLIQSRFESDRLLHILDIGCGVGHFTEILGRELGARAQIVGIDPNADVVRQGMERIGKSDVKNVELKAFTIAEFDEGKKYDVVMFTKSLHHCVPLDESVSKAHYLLAPNGLFIAEELVRDVPVATSHWFFDRLELLFSTGLLFSSSDIKIPHSNSHHGDNSNAHLHSHHGDTNTHVHSHHGETTGEQSHIPFAMLVDQKLSRSERRSMLVDQKLSRSERWSKFFQHNPSLPVKEEIVAAISKVFGNEKTKVSGNTFFYQHFAVGLQDAPVGAQILSNLMSQELRAVEDGSIVQAGCNIIAEKN
ncbi:S-adenosyl-L-methionine-dependent methyltransferase [Endogone sp. FLAS-F59071]|nr:S-adenosyl-L-methionine-dependent methyltransferase [Endogone sp. FLAS-F59071]|eukprot:RUS21237.1 S-adenosyl-L-methionine-dependent methyltransferase [Endogone sp. FLAS-F59071]